MSDPRRPYIERPSIERGRVGNRVAYFVTAGRNVWGPFDLETAISERAKLETALARVAARKGKE